MKCKKPKKRNILFPFYFPNIVGYILVAVFLIALFPACTPPKYPQGKIMYENFCANCHMDDGTGLAAVIPPLAGSDFLKNNPHLLPCIIHKGLKKKIEVNGTVYDTEMPGAPFLEEFEVTNIINYINTAWGNDFGIVKHMEVREALEKCE